MDPNAGEAKNDVGYAVFEWAPEFIHVCDPQGTLLDTNRETEERLGYAKADLVGKPLGVLYDEAALELFKEAFPMLLRHGRSRHEVTLVAKDGRAVTVECCGRVIRDAEGRVRTIAVYERDITERKNAEAALQKAHDELEAKVQERTRDLQEANEELRRTRSRLAEMSRRAGMAEVATDVLHNVSNTLNSVLVGSEVLVRSIEGMRLDGVAQAAALLEQHAGGLGLYLEEDEQGKHLPAYLKALGRSLVEGREAARREIGRLRENLDAIRCIVISQQAHAGARHIVETFAPREAADEAIDLHAQALERKGVEVTREYAAMPPIVCDRHRLLQILGNLVKNAAEAFPDDAPRPRRLIVRVAPADGERVRIEVEDTGEGIAPEHLERLFSHGFTTRPGGHGFGLHGAANIAQQLGGSLTARSDGRGRGATFLLDLPLRIRGDDAVDRPSPAAASETKAPQIS